MRVTASTRIESPPEQVFDTLADVRNDARWNSRVSSAELRSPEPIGLGSRFAMVNGGSPYDVTITTHDRPSRLVLEARGKPDLTIAYTLTPAAKLTLTRSARICCGAMWTSDSITAAGAERLQDALYGAFVRLESR